MKETIENTAQAGNYVIVEKQNYRKLCKITENGILTLGKEQIEMKGMIGMPYWTTFKMVQSKLNKKTFILEVAPKAETSLELRKNLTSGTDNRTIIDDGTSQKLSKEEIEDLRESGKSSNEIVESLIVNSKSFAAKTEYSQDKYIKKKERKYFRYLTIRRPTIDLLQEIYFKQDYARINCLRMDSLAQILSYSDIKASGVYMLYDSGSMGLPAAAMLNRIGADTDGSIIHLHPGNQPQTTLVQAMNFSKEQLERLLAVNLYSFLRLHYQGEEVIMEEITLKSSLSEPIKFPGIEKGMMENNTSKMEETPNMEQLNEPQENSEASETINPLKRKLSEESDTVVKKKPKWLMETSKAVELCKNNKLEGLVIIAKEHPLNIVNALLPFLGNSRPFVIYHCYREPLQETYVALKQRRDIINLRLFSNFLRSYQVLPNRTHPDILTSDLGGYILTGYLVD
ncbi:tRNA (adenine(58)-N(1))-methyltransferase non-catalytic subunit TRM6 [Venturia canescens]|uniref:tRNA (adenine(58)-N(1))-methyltransferase non-catalytic subunit TRM6 n=1 Tax=Venturia canescens TaxID=32260 RepID=UPI001C9CE95B|nr:tRNA (adenine(58)-N(1))-methyltransferase non-catalytic subunit TRM6 [Venturia canescens]